MIKSTLVALLLPLALASPIITDRQGLESRFGPSKVFRSVRDDHDSHYRARALGSDEENFQMTWNLHAHDQDAVDSVIGGLTDPSSSSYGQWLSAEAAHELTKAHPGGVEMILDFLGAFGIGREDVSLAHGNRTVSFPVNAETASSMLGAVYEVHSTDAHPTTGKRAQFLGARSISLPEGLHSYVARVTPGVTFNLMRPHGKQQRSLTRSEVYNLESNVRGAEEHLARREMAGYAEEEKRDLKPIATSINAPVNQPLTSNLNTCWSSFYPPCVRAEYHVPSQNQATAGTSIGVLNLGAVCANKANVVYGLSKIAPNVPASFYPERIDIPVAGVTALTCDPTDSGEPDLDLQTAIPLVYPMQVYNFQTGDYTDAALFGAVQNMGHNGIPRPDVLSVSWGGTEDVLSDALAVCAQTDAIIAQGTTLVASTGDTGDQDNEYPALCPNWLSVGASDIHPNQSVTAAQWAEEANAGWDYHGSGGFSSLQQPAQSFQVPHLAAYKAQYTDPTYGSLQGYAADPDVSAQGRNYIIGTGATPKLYYYGGTSLSSPMFGGILALINAVRKAAGKGTIGNPRPAFYANTNLFRDVTQGSNYYGNLKTSNQPWPALSGWDPATGLGTPLYDRLLSYYQSN